MASFSVFPRGSPEQRLRFRRYLIASSTSLLVIFLLGLCYREGVLAARPFATASISIVALISVFYVLFRTGLNEKARDPSLTIPMMVSAISVTTYALYHVGQARGVFLLVYLVIMLFGTLRLGTRRLLGVSAFILCAYGLVISLPAPLPAQVERPRVEMLQWMVLTVVLIWFSFMGGYIRDLRKRLKQSEYDELTGIYNRRRILEILAHEKIRCDRGAGALCVGIVDIDRFKRINDSFGHQVGDVALQAFVRVAQKELRAIDFIGRYGGEEFLIVLTQTGLDGARECAERVRRQTESARPADRTQDWRISVSLGITQYRPGELLRDALARADAALYRAKAAGRNRIEYE